jgi:F-type H+-transporting ATPase subunit b
VELSLTTFLLEIVNFLVLIWILQRFLYRPVLDVIARRRQLIEDGIRNAQQTQASAQALREQYDNRLQQWEEEKAAARETLKKELDEERSRQLNALQTTLDQHKEKHLAIEQRHREEALQRAERVALENATRFATELLMQLAGPALEGRIAELVLSHLQDLPASSIETLKSAHGQDDTTLRVSSAFPLPDDTREALRQWFTNVLGNTTLRWEFQEDPSLIAGLRIGLGPWVLGANLQDELRCFREAACG